MLKRNYLKKAVALCGIVTMLMGTVGVSAASGSATVNSNCNRVTVTYSDCYGSTICYLKGTEQNPSNKKTKNYSQQMSTTTTGKGTFKFSSTNGWKFVLSGLKSSIYINGNNVAEFTVTQ